MPAYLSQLLWELASLQHSIWSHWMFYLFSVCEHNSDGSVTIPKDKVQRWKKQMNTSFTNLSDEEQLSDLNQAEKLMPTLKKYLD